MQKYKRKGPVSNKCSWCGKFFKNTKLFSTHIREVGEKNCIKANKE